MGPVGPCNSDRCLGSDGLCGVLSPVAPESAILMDPGGMFPSSDPAESAALMGPVGPTMTLEVLPLSDFEWRGWKEIVLDWG